MHILRRVKKDPNHSIENIQAAEHLLERKEGENIHKRIEQSKRIGRGVTPLAQQIFDHLFRVLPGRNKVAWDGKVIRMCGNSFLLRDPYKQIELEKGAQKTQEFMWAAKQLQDFWKRHEKQPANAESAI